MLSKVKVTRIKVTKLKVKVAGKKCDISIFSPLSKVNECHKDQSQRSHRMGQGHRSRSQVKVKVLGGDFFTTNLREVRHAGVF